MTAAGAGPTPATDITEDMPDNNGYTLQIMNSPLGDFTLGGVSAQRSRAVVIGRLDLGIVEAMPEWLRNGGGYGDSPLLAVKRVGDVDSLVPVVRWGDQFVPATEAGKVGPMSGGNVAIADAHTDGKFLKWLTGDPAVKHGVFLKIHDRFETQAQYDANFD